MIVEAVNEFLRHGDYKRATIHYDMNCIKIRLYGKADQHAYLIYLYSPWRIVQDGHLLTSSSLYPSEYLYESKDDHRRAFSEFCDRTKGLECHRILRIEVKPISNDLTIEWEGGLRLEKICMSEDSDYHIYDLLSKLSHDFGFNSYASVSEEDEVVDISVKRTDGCPQK